MAKPPQRHPGRENLRLKVLLPMSIGLLVFLGLYTASTSWYLNREIYRDLNSTINDIDSRFKELLSHRSELMTVQLQQFAADENLQQLMTARNRDGGPSGPGRCPRRFPFSSRGPADSGPRDDARGPPSDLRAGKPAGAVRLYRGEHPFSEPAAAARRT